MNDIYQEILKRGTFMEQLLMTKEQAVERMGVLETQMERLEGVTEQLKKEIQILWEKRMKGIRVRAEENVREELIYGLYEKEQRNLLLL